MSEDQAPLRLALGDADPGDQADPIVCPVCGDDAIHVGTVQEIPYDPGSMTVIGFWGECSHSFDLVLKTHAGTTSAYLENAMEMRPAAMWRE